ncbi:MAG: DNA-3-methyladenine glycosylase 2 family protein [Gemmatimonadetes bacterium]|nr:DNA-3-methyladenine glycosylase 2 family protein [Gemmatimonadota bacterium]
MDPYGSQGDRYRRGRGPRAPGRVPHRPAHGRGRRLLLPERPARPLRIPRLGYAGQRARGLVREGPGAHRHGDRGGARQVPAPVAGAPPRGAVKPAVLRPAAAHAALGADPAFGPWVARIGPPRLRRVTEAPFEYLARAIVYQQLAGAAASTIHGRFVEALGGKVTSRRILGAPEASLRGAGLSRGKLAALRDLAAKAPRLGLKDLPRLSDDEVEHRLTAVKGIGPWTAHMFLMFYLRRADVWPVGDLGVRAGYARIHGLTEVPGAKALASLGEPYRPWRSAAAWYCWRALETEPWSG